MINFSYTVSPFLKKEIDTIDNLRSQIILTLTKPRDELRLRWDETINRIDAASALRGYNVNKTHIGKLLRPQGKKNFSPEEQFVIRYKNAFDYIRYEWMLENKNVEAHDLEKLYFLLEQTNLKVEHNELKSMCSFLQVRAEHPIVQSAIAFIIYYHMLGQNEPAKIHSLLLVYLFLYKTGYDLRGLLNLERYILEHNNSLFELITASLKNKNISPFLDYFALAMVTQAERANEKLVTRRFDSHFPESYFHLSERQKEILANLDQPSKIITNRMVQEQFKISQITASRELSHLASLGLVFAYGKGRSVHYKKS